MKNINRHHTANAAVHDYAPYDEIGVPDDAIERCRDCGVLFPVGEWHRCEDTGEVVAWEEYSA